LFCSEVAPAALDDLLPKLAKTNLGQLGNLIAGGIEQICDLAPKISFCPSAVVAGIPIRVP
jgi:hypothetical protein